MPGCRRRCGVSVTPAGADRRRSAKKEYPIDGEDGKAEHFPYIMFMIMLQCVASTVIGFFCEPLRTSARR